jgi:uncharacterized iron-regulated membrane protein
MTSIPARRDAPDSPDPTPKRRPSVAFWRKWHRWIAFPAAIFLLWAAGTGIVVAGTEFFGADEAKREALRRMVSSVTTTAPMERLQEPLVHAFAAVVARAGNVPVDRAEIEFKGESPTIVIFTGKPEGGEDRKFVIDAASGEILSVESYADKPFLYRLHSGEAFGDGGLVVAMFWGLSLVWLTLSGLLIYWRIRRRGAVGLKRFFW